MTSGARLRLATENGVLFTTENLCPNDTIYRRFVANGTELRFEADGSTFNGAIYYATVREVL